MIVFTKGDMFAVPADARVNTVNTLGVMGAGVALAFKTRYPDMFADYKRACQEGLVRPGALHVWKNLTGDWVINFPTKRDWREPSRYEDIAAGLNALRDYLKQQGPVSVSLPALGCGHGGLEWSRVSSMIRDSLGDLEAKILVFEPEDSRRAGKNAKGEPTDDELKKLQFLGFERDSKSQSGGSFVSWIRGDQDILLRRWIALVPSKDPNEKEITALAAVSKQLAEHTDPPPFALVYLNHHSEEFAEMLLQYGLKVVLLLPFGPLTREGLMTKIRHDSLSILTTAGAKDSWSQPLLREATNYLKENADRVLITDPDPQWLTERSIRDWTQRPLFYISYGTHTDRIRSLFQRVDAHAIMRRSKDNEPNVGGLIAGNAKSSSRAVHITANFDKALAPKIKRLAEVIERHESNGSLTIDIPAHASGNELAQEIRNIFENKKP